MMRALLIPPKRDCEFNHQRTNICLTEYSRDNGTKKGQMTVLSSALSPGCPIQTINARYAIILLQIFSGLQAKLQPGDKWGDCKPQKSGYGRGPVFYPPSPKKINGPAAMSGRGVI